MIDVSRRNFARSMFLHIAIAIIFILPISAVLVPNVKKISSPKKIASTTILVTSKTIEKKDKKNELSNTNKLAQDLSVKKNVENTLESTNQSTSSSIVSKSSNTTQTEVVSTLPTEVKNDQNAQSLEIKKVAPVETSNASVNTKLTKKQEKTEKLLVSKKPKIVFKDKPISIKKASNVKNISDTNDKKVSHLVRKKPKFAVLKKSNKLIQNETNTVETTRPIVNSVDTLEVKNNTEEKVMQHKSVKSEVATELPSIAKNVNEEKIIQKTDDLVNSKPLSLEVEKIPSNDVKLSRKEESFTIDENSILSRLMVEEYSEEYNENQHMANTTNMSFFNKKNDNAMLLGQLNDFSSNVTTVDDENTNISSEYLEQIFTSEESSIISIDSSLSNSSVGVKYLIMSQIMPCWNEYSNRSSIAKNVSCQLLVTFDSIGGIISIEQQENTYTRSQEKALFAQISRDATQALQSCTPLQNMPSDSYQEWKRVSFSFHYNK